MSQYIKLPATIADFVNSELIKLGVAKSSKEKSEFTQEELSSVKSLHLYTIEQIDVLKFLPNVEHLTIASFNVNRPFYPVKPEQWQKFVSLAGKVRKLEIYNMYGLSEFDCSSFPNLQDLKLANCLNLKHILHDEQLHNLQVLGNENLKMDISAITDKIVANYKQGIECVCECDLGLSYQIINTLLPLCDKDEEFLYYLARNVLFEQPLYHGVLISYNIVDVIKLVEKTKEIVADINPSGASPIQKAFNALVWMNKNINIDQIGSPDLPDKKEMKYISREAYNKVYAGLYDHAESGVFGPIMYGRTICEGAARTFSYLMRACGEETSFILCHIYNEDFYKNKQKNQRVNENTPSTHVMSILRIDDKTVTIIDPVGTIRALDTKLVDNYNIGYSFKDLDNNNVIVRFCDCEYEKCKVLKLKEILACTKQAYETVYKEKEPAKLRQAILDKNQAKKDYKERTKKEKDKILEEEAEKYDLSALER